MYAARYKDIQNQTLILSIAIPTIIPTIPVTDVTARIVLKVNIESSIATSAALISSSLVSYVPRFLMQINGPCLFFAEFLEDEIGQGD